MSGRLAGRRAVVTGAARGIGAAIAAAFVAEGASVVVADQLAAEGEATVRALGGGSGLVVGDLAQPETWRRVVAEAGPRLDVLVNNAGGLRHPQQLHELDLDDWRDELDRNLTSVFLGMRAAIPLMLSAGGGSIVNMSSISGTIGQDDAPAYQAAKAGVRLLTKNAAVSYGPHNIRVNAICPGAIDTEAVRDEDPARLGPFLARTPLGRQGLPDEVARAAVYLASDEAAFVTGVDLFVDGGYRRGERARWLSVPTSSSSAPASSGVGGAPPRRGRRRRGPAARPRWGRPGDVGRRRRLRRSLGRRIEQRPRRRLARGRELQPRLLCGPAR